MTEQEDAAKALAAKVADMCRELKEGLSIDVMADLIDFAILNILAGHYGSADKILGKITTVVPWYNLIEARPPMDPAIVNGFHLDLINNYWRQVPERRVDEWLPELLSSPDPFQDREIQVRKEQTKDVFRYPPFADFLQQQEVSDALNAELAGMVPLHSENPSDLAARALLFSRLDSEGRLPSHDNTKAACEAATRWLALKEISSSQDLELPWTLIVDLCIQCDEYEIANKLILEQIVKSQYKNAWKLVQYPSFLSRQRDPISLEKIGFDLHEAANSIVAAMHSRKSGRQEIDPHKTMAEIVDQLQEVSWDHHSEEFRDRGISKVEGLRNAPASPLEIGMFEVHTMRLPQDLKDFLAITNGFQGSGDWLAGGVSQIANPQTSKGGSGSFTAGTDPKIIKSLRDACYAAQSRFVEPTEVSELSEDEEEESEEEEEEEVVEANEADEDVNEDDYEDITDEEDEDEEEEEDSGEESDEDAHLMDFLAEDGSVQYVQIGPYYSTPDIGKPSAVYLVSPAMLAYWPGIEKEAGKWRVVVWRQNSDTPEVFGSFRHWICHSIRELEEKGRST